MARTKPHAQPPKAQRFSITFHVPGDPVPKQRARANPGGKAYYAKRPRGSKRLSYPEYKELVRQYCEEAMWAGFPFGQCPPRPEAWDTCDWKISVRVRCGAGDLNNIIGAIEDALQQGRCTKKCLWPCDAHAAVLWKNDSHVVRHGDCTLERVGPREPRGVTVTAEVLEP